MEVKKAVDMMEISTAVKKIVADHLVINPDCVTDEFSLSDYLRGDTLEAVELVMILEEEFDVEIDSAEVEKITTVGSFVDFLTVELQNKNTPLE